MKRVLIVSVLLLTGCAGPSISSDTHKLYNGAVKASSEVGSLETGATIRSGALFDGIKAQARVVSVNGEAIGTDIDQVDMLPGSYTIKLAIRQTNKDSDWNSGVREFEKNERISFEAGQSAELVFKEVPSFEGPRFDVNVKLKD